MMQAWIAVALLAGSWLLGLGYYYPASPLAWIAAVAAGTILLGRSFSSFSFVLGNRPDDGARASDAAAPRRPHPNPLPEGEETFSGPHPGPLPKGEGAKWIALVLLLPAIWFAPWPYRAAPLLLAAGLAGELLAVPAGFFRRLAAGAWIAGAVLFAQALGMTVYAGFTAGRHDLPWPLPEVLAGIAGVLKIDAAADGSAVVMHSMCRSHRLAATWELLLDPPTVCFLVGCAVIISLAIWTHVPPQRRRSAWLAALATLAAVMLAWLPIRAAMMTAFYLQRVLRSEADAPLHAMNHFFSPWVLMLLLLGPLLLAWRFVRWPAAGEASADEPPEATPGRPQTPPKHETAEQGADPEGVHSAAPAAGWRYAAAAALALLAAATLSAAIEWDPVGKRKAGRVMVVERHSTWEPTTRPYDTTWYGEPSGYNYAVMYDTLGQFYQMSRLVEAEKIDDDALSQCDVLIIKTPTARYTADEVAAVQRFVRLGGGLLLIGDHTNYERSSTILNDITRPLGFSYRPDLLFGFGESPYEELYVAPAAPHPVVQHLPPMDFAVSCSLDPGRSRGRTAILGTGLWSMPPEYHHENFHPVPEHCPEMRYGAFVQLWAVRYGKGRVLPFTDSTIFSNFCLFQPGKAEMLLGLVEWLNHSDAGDPRTLLLLAAVLPLGGALWLARGRRGAWLMLLSGGACGWALTSAAVAVAQRQGMPPPKPIRPLVQAVIDRTVSDVPLSKGPYTQGEGKGYGLLEQWIPRLGYLTARRTGRDVFSGDVLVVICPSRPVSAEFRQGLVRYVADGGKLLLVDSPENAASTANSLLWPFGLSLSQAQSGPGTLMLADQWPALKVEQSREVSGGRPVAWLGQQRSAAAIAEHGRGRVLAVGCGSLWNDTNMGETWMTEPSDEVRTRYEVFYALARLLVEDEPIVAPAPQLPEPKERLLEEPRPRR
jgi:hypothetical protein